MLIFNLTRDRIASNVSPHTAELLLDGGWKISCFPGRVVTENQAMAAMQFADMLDDAAPSWVQRWLAEFATQIGESVASLTAAVRQPPRPLRGVAARTTLLGQRS